MTLSISRFFKFVSGFSLIGITLFSTSSSASSVMLYALVGIPFVFAAIFDWRPLEKAFDKMSFSFLLAPEFKPLTKK